MRNEGVNSTANDPLGEERGRRFVFDVRTKSLFDDEYEQHRHDRSSVTKLDLFVSR